jgi:copper chaperone CopZ
MHCQGCINSVTKALKALNGVFDVAVSLEGKFAIVGYDKAKLSPEQLLSAVEEAGYDARMK